MSRPPEEWLLIASICCVLAALGVVAVFYAIQGWLVRRSGRRVTGAVVGHHTSGWARLSRTSQEASDEGVRPLPRVPIVGFRTEDGREFRVRQSSGVILEELEVGYPMTVYYDPRNPKRAVVGEQADVVGSLLVGFALLVFPTVVGAYCILQLVLSTGSLRPSG
jgi:hypothetical protein